MTDSRRHRTSRPLLRPSKPGSKVHTSRCGAHYVYRLGCPRVQPRIASEGTTGICGANLMLIFMIDESLQASYWQAV